MLLSLSFVVSGSLTIYSIGSLQASETGLSHSDCLPFVNAKITWAMKRKNCIVLCQFSFFFFQSIASVVTLLISLGADCIFWVARNGYICEQSIEECFKYHD